jgi:hypothetical protein
LKIHETKHKAFETWKYKGVRFLAFGINDNGNIGIIDEYGTNYGGWFSSEEFRKDHENGSRIGTPLGKAKLYVRPVN